MDLMKEFEAYLPKWSNDKHLPIPTKEHMDRWYRAWGDFVKEELEPRWDNIREEYKSLRLYNPDEPMEEVEEETEETQEEIEESEIVEEVVEEEPANSWEEIQKIMKNL